MSQKIDVSEFVTFTRPGSKLGDKFVRLTAKGGFLFSSGCVHAEGLGQYSHCTLGYNATTREILLTFTSTGGVEGAIKLTHRIGNTSSLQSSSFFNFFGLNPKKLEGRYGVEKYRIPHKGQAYIISLDKKINRG